MSTEMAYCIGLSPTDRSPHYLFWLRPSGYTDSHAALGAVSLQRMRCALVGVVLGMLVLPAAAGAMPTHSLKMFEARAAAESAAFDFQIRRSLDSSSVGRCARKSLSRILCAATVTGESETKTRTCRLRIRVRAVYRTYYWDEVAAVIQRHCQSEAKPFLSYHAAFAAIQAEADRFAGRATTITHLSRDDEVTFNGTAEWERPRMPPSEFLPTEKCSVRLVATLVASGLSVSNDGFLCY